jgi:hypothetical protein
MTMKKDNLLDTPAMSMNSSQVGVALFPSLYHNFYISMKLNEIHHSFE